MSMYFVGDESESTQNLFYKRLAYDLVASTTSKSPVTDFYIGEKQLYGRVDFDYIPMVLGKGTPGWPARQHKQFNTSRMSNPQVQQGAPAYVVDAFEAMAKTFEKAVITRQIPGGHPYLSALKVHSSYQDPTVAYRTYIQNYGTTLGNGLNRLGLPIINIRQLIEYCDLQILPKLSSVTPLTLSAFLKSSHTSVANSGLAIEIADLTKSNDDEKIQHFLKAPAWEFYVNAARQHGFLIDRHIPWRLVADIGSSAMLQHSRKYGLNTTAKLIDVGFQTAYTPGFVLFMEFFLYLYKLTVSKTVEMERLCADGKRRFVSFPTQQYTLIDMINEVGERTFLELYMKIRMQEEYSQFDEHQRLSLVSECLELYDISQNQQAALHVFSRIINKTFDYRGSLSYIMKYRQEASGASLTADVGGSMSQHDSSGGGY